MDTTNGERLPKELRGIPLAPRDVDAPGQGLSIYEEPASARRLFRWMPAVGYSISTVAVGGLLIPAIISKNPRKTCARFFLTLWTNLRSRS